MVRFGEATAKVTAAGETSLTVVVPDAAVPGNAALTVQVGRRRSKPVAFEVLKALRISALEPDVALPGEEVTVKGAGLDNAGLVLSVEGKATPVFDVQTTSLRFRVPALATDPVRSVPVLLKTKEQVAKPVDLLIGKLPLVLTVNPRTVEAGDRVVLKGRGFAPDPGANRVHIGRALALVLQAEPDRAHGRGPGSGHVGARESSPSRPRAGRTAPRSRCRSARGRRPPIACASTPPPPRWRVRSSWPRWPGRCCSWRPRTTRPRSRNGP